MPKLNEQVRNDIDRVLNLAETTPIDLINLSPEEVDEVLETYTITSLENFVMIYTHDVVEGTRLIVRHLSVTTEDGSPPSYETLTELAADFQMGKPSSWSMCFETETASHVFKFLMLH